MDEIRSYASVRGSNPAVEFFRLFKRSMRTSHNLKEEVQYLLREIREAEAILYERTGVRAEGLKVLEIGPGQLPRQMAYFAIKNDVVGIDLDVIPSKPRVSEYLQIARRNGIRRVLKTVTRKAMGFDREFGREMRAQLGVSALPETRVLEMDATQARFPDESFDLIYSFSVFEHLPDPAAVLRDNRRLLKPGGAMIHHLHLYTCDDGCHDLRIRRGFREGDLPYWPHLRPQHAHVVQPFAYINKLRIADWKTIAERELPGATLANDWYTGEMETQLSRLRAAGELSDYTDEELLTHNLMLIWRKPR